MPRIEVGKMGSIKACNQDPTTSNMIRDRVPILYLFEGYNYLKDIQGKIPKW